MGFDCVLVICDRGRPDTLVICNMCTVMIGEDKVPGLMHEAIKDLKSYAQGGLVAAQYGAVPGIPAYAASGHELQFCFISHDGQVRPWYSSCLEVAFRFVMFS